MNPSNASQGVESKACKKHVERDVQLTFALEKDSVQMQKASELLSIIPSKDSDTISLQRLPTIAFEPLVLFCSDETVSQTSKEILI